MRLNAAQCHSASSLLIPLSFRFFPRDPLPDRHPTPARSETLPFLPRSAAPVVGILAERLFLFDGNLAEMGHLSPGNTIVRHNADALGNALLVCLEVPWALCLIFYSLLHLTYKHDRQVAHEVEIGCQCRGVRQTGDRVAAGGSGRGARCAVCGGEGEGDGKDLEADGAGGVGVRVAGEEPEEVGLMSGFGVAGQNEGEGRDGEGRAGEGELHEVSLGPAGASGSGGRGEDEMGRLR